MICWVLCVQFKCELKSCIARYQELYKYLVQAGSQRLITEFFVKSNQPSEPLEISSNVVPFAAGNISPLQYESDESDFLPVPRKRTRLPSESDESDFMPVPCKRMTVYRQNAGPPSD